MSLNLLLVDVMSTSGRFVNRLLLVDMALNLLVVDIIPTSGRYVTKSTCGRYNIYCW